jgi:hypothetical protein
MDEPTNENARAIVLTCMDYRYPLTIVEYMSREGLTGSYYHVILAGASLGAVLDELPPENIKLHWGETFFDHLDIVLAPPGIQKVYILDHRGCKAYQIFRGLTDDVDPGDEQRAHEREMNKLKAKIQAKYPGLPVITALFQKLKDEEEYTALEIE